MSGDGRTAAPDPAFAAAAARGDAAALVGLWLQGADGPGAAFFLTQAYVCALEAGDARAAALRARLRAMGSED